MNLFFSLIVILSLSNTIFASELGDSPKKSNSCFQFANSKLLRLYTEISSQLTVEQLFAVEKTCNDLKSAGIYTKKGFFEEIADDLTNYGAAGILFGGAASAFSSLNDNDVQKKYMSELEKIKEIPDRMERIRRVYMLTSKYQGKYDEETLGARSDFVGGKMLGASRPENLIDMAQKEGSSGVCRHFASLLNWSLLQVSRYKYSTGSALTENDFSSTFIIGKTPVGGHAWVRVNLPVRDQKGKIDFFRFDLDTTWNPGIFAPLMERRSGLSEEKRKEVLNECERVHFCLSQQLDNELKVKIRKLGIRVNDEVRTTSPVKKVHILNESKTDKSATKQ